MKNPQAIYEQLRQLVKENVPQDFAITENPEEGKIEVRTTKEAIVNGQKKPYMDLLSVIVQKGHVGFYFMPLYLDETIRDELPDTMRKMLKGKSCIHCTKELSEEYQQEFKKLIHSGVSLFEARQWV